MERWLCDDKKDVWRNRFSEILGKGFTFVTLIETYEKEMWLTLLEPLQVEGFRETFLYEQKIDYSCDSYLSKVPTGEESSNETEVSRQSRFQYHNPYIGCWSLFNVPTYVWTEKSVHVSLRLVRKFVKIFEG